MTGDWAAWSAASVARMRSARDLGQGVLDDDWGFLFPLSGFEVRVLALGAFLSGRFSGSWVRVSFALGFW